MQFNMYSPSNFNAPQQQMGQQMGQGQFPIPNQQQEFQFYATLFNILDTQKKKALSGGQVFNFFLSSKLKKDTLADIWDAVKQNGVLVVESFVTAMKLITLAQKGIKPDPANLNTVQYVGPPDLQYPPNTRLLAPVGTIVQGQGGQAQQQHAKQASVADPFSALDLGFKPTSSSGSLPGVSKPAGPTWNKEPTPTSGAPAPVGVAAAVASGKNTATSSPQMNGMIGQSFPSSMNIGATGGSAGPSGIGGAGPIANGSMGGIGSIGGGINQYGPSAALKTAHVRQSTRTIVDPSGGVGVGVGVGAAHAHGGTTDYTSADESGALPALGRATSRRLFEDERAREELRAANQREKMARQQLNDARITNEKLERENEQFRMEIREAREAQANALKQSGEALSAIQPLRVENEKLKVAIAEWKELITTKDNEFEQLEGELEGLRAENEKQKNDVREITEQLNDLTYQVTSLKSKLDEANNENKRNLKEISMLKDEKLRIESEKRDLDLEIVKLQSNLKSMERKVKEQNKQNDAKRRESDLFNSFGNGFGPGQAAAPNSLSGNRGRRSTTGSRSRSPMQKAQAGPPIDVMLGSGALAPGAAATTTTDSSSNDIKSGGKSDDIFAGLSHSPVIKEEKLEVKVTKDEFDDFGNDTSFPEFGSNPPPPSGVGSGGADDRIDIGGGAIAPPSGDIADIGMKSGDDSGGLSEYEEVDVEDTVMEEYEVQEKKLVTVPKEVQVVRIGDREIVVKPGDVQDDVYTGQETYGGSDWFLKLNIFNSNRGHFVKSDLDKDGKLNVKEAWAFFQLAKMDAKVLQQAWKLVATGHNDPELPKDGLAEIQFHCMFQMILTMKKKQMTQCPAEVPDALQFDVIRMLGQPVSTKSQPMQEEQIVTVKKTRPVKKMSKKRVKKQKGGKKNKPSKKSQPPPLPADNDDFGFGAIDDAGPGAAATSNNNNNNATDDFGGFGDFGDFGGNDTKPADTKKSSKKPEATSGGFDDFGTDTGATPGGDWDNWGNADW